MRIAAVDCGTNSIRLLVADRDGPHKLDVHREMRIVRLGQDVDRTGVLAPQALARTGEALADYGATCRRLGVQRTRMVATSATRDAANRDELTALVHKTLGVEPEVISGEQEAALSFDGATRGLDRALAPFLVIDIGGGSTEFVFGTEQVEASLSVDVGCVRLAERHLAGDPPTTAQIQAAAADVSAALAQVRQFVPVERARTVVGLAGSVTTVAALALGLGEYQQERIHLARVGANRVRQVTDDLLAVSTAERAANPVVHPGRADVIGAGALVLATVLESFGARDVLVSEADVLDGIAWSVSAVTA